MTKLQYYRKEKCLSQFDLAVKSGLSIQSIQKYEQGIYPIEGCRIDSLLSLGKVLNVPFYMLLEDEKIAGEIMQQINNR